MNLAGPETRERAEKIGASFVHEAPTTTCPHCRAILFVRSGKCEDCGKPVAVPERRRVVFDQWPLKRLHVRGALSDLQFAAGLRYYAHWYGSGLVKFGAANMEGAGSSREPSYGMAASERQAHHRQLYRIGEEALEQEFSPYVDAIVLREQEPEAVGKLLTGRSHPQQSRAVAIELLKLGLDRLAKAYGLG